MRAQPVRAVAAAKAARARSSGGGGGGGAWRGRVAGVVLGERRQVKRRQRRRRTGARAVGWDGRAGGRAGDADAALVVGDHLAHHALREERGRTRGCYGCGHRLAGT